MSEIAETEIELKGKSVDFFVQNVETKTLNFELEFFENYYLNNFTSYLEYPDGRIEYVGK